MQMTVVFLLTGCGRTCAFMLKFIQGSVKKHTGRLLWSVYVMYQNNFVSKYIARDISEL